MDEQDIARKAFFNTRAHTWLEKFYKNPETLAHDRYSEQIKAIVASLNIGQNDRVLDVGCGSGVLVPYILDRLGPNGSLVEVDYAEKMIEANQKEHSDQRITFVCSDVMDMAFETPCFDSIICFACFPHFSDKRAALFKLAVLLKAEGVLTIAHLLSSKEISSHHSGETAVFQDRLVEIAEMEKLCRDCGLGITEYKDRPGEYTLRLQKL